MRQRRIVDTGPKRARVEPHACVVQLNRQPAEVARRAIQVVLLRLAVPNLDELACGAVDEVCQVVEDVSALVVHAREDALERVEGVLLKRSR